MQNVENIGVVIPEDVSEQEIPYIFAIDNLNWIIIIKNWKAEHSMPQHPLLYKIITANKCVTKE